MDCCDGLLPFSNRDKHCSRSLRVHRAVIDGGRLPSITLICKWRWGQKIRRALDATAAAVENVRVDHCGADVLVTQELLNRANVVAGL